VVYYGNPKEDAELFSFRDNKISQYIKNLIQNKQELDTLLLIQIDREETIKGFKKIDNKTENKTMY